LFGEVGNKAGDFLAYQEFFGIAIGGGRGQGERTLRKAIRGWAKIHFNSKKGLSITRVRGGTGDHVAENSDVKSHRKGEMRIGKKGKRCPLRACGRANPGSEVGRSKAREKNLKKGATPAEREKRDQFRASLTFHRVEGRLKIGRHRGVREGVLNLAKKRKKRRHYLKGDRVLGDRGAARLPGYWFYSLEPQECEN